METIKKLVGERKEDFTTRLLVATALFAEKYYTGQEANWGKVTSELAKRAEAQFNDPTNAAYMSPTFAAVIEAQTGEKIGLRRPSQVEYQAGVCVVPVNPLYGTRSEDGYEVGQAYVCTNETSGGKFRNAGNLNVKGVRTVKSGVRTGDAESNEWKVMSHASDEVRPADEKEIRALVDSLFTEGKPLSMLHDLERELSRYDAFIK